MLELNREILEQSDALRTRLAEVEVENGRLRTAAEDMLSTYRHDDKTVLVSAERQEAWAEAIKRSRV